MRSVLRELTIGTVLLVFALLAHSQNIMLVRSGDIYDESPANERPVLSEYALEDRSSGQSNSDGVANPDLVGNVSGTILYGSGGIGVGANVQLTCKNQSFNQTMASDNNGQFFFSRVPPGPFQLQVTAPGFTTQFFSGDLQPGQAYLVPPIALGIGTVEVTVQVGDSSPEIAEEEIREQEKQRIFSVIPNFYVTYLPNATPLNPPQKFELAWKTAIDPVTFVGAGIYAALEQAGDRYPEFGQGAEGYAKRYGVGYADAVAGIFIGNAILPSLLKQDPRFFYKGTGTTRSRLAYALASSVICKGDNRRWQPNYSFILGSIAVGGISNLYVPASDRNSLGLVFQNALIRIGQGSLGGVLQEFVIPRLTPHLSQRKAAQP